MWDRLIPTVCLSSRGAATHPHDMASHAQNLSLLSFDTTPPCLALRRKTLMAMLRGKEGHAGGEKRNSRRCKPRPLESRLHHYLGFVFVSLLFVFLKLSIFQVLQPSIFWCYVRRVAFDLFLDCFFLMGCTTTVNHHFSPPCGRFVFELSSIVANGKQIQDGWPGLERFQSQAFWTVQLDAWSLHENPLLNYTQFCK